jgi:hypothetical protein
MAFLCDDVFSLLKNFKTMEDLSKEIDAVSQEILKVKSKIESLDTLLCSKYKTWPEMQRTRFTNHSEARKEYFNLQENEKQLRQKEKQLRQKENLLIQKENQLGQDVRKKEILLIQTHLQVLRLQHQKGRGFLYLLNLQEKNL